MDAFESAALAMVEEFWDYEPFASNECSVRFWLIRLVSDDFGIKNPAVSYLADQETALESSFSSTTAMGITTNLVACRDAVLATELLDADFICVLVSDPAEHAGAWFYPASDITLISDANSWGVYLAHELGHLIADLGEEYPCYSCFRSGNYPASDDWNRTFDPDNDEPVDSPNLATDLNATPWEISPYIYETPTEDIPTSNLNAYRGKMVGAWQGGGTYRHGVWRSEEYCIMDTMMNHWNEFFCEVCESAIENELSACFATTPSDLIVPSHMGERPIRAMHGFHPDAPHSYAALMTNQPDVPSDINAIPDMFKLMTRDAVMAHALNRVPHGATANAR
jgi:hypothetical protein